jgi:prepilin-type N-terminal cleavage/methylation domain-containing protein
MRTASTNSSHGFTLIEMMIALGVGLLVLGASVELFTKSVNATWIVSQKSELQQDARAASSLLIKDISLAGAGLPTGGVGLPPQNGANGTGTLQLFGCGYIGAQCFLGPNNNAARAYPTQTSQGIVTPYLYGLIPGCQAGITVAGNPTPTDTITIVYSDNVFPLSDYTTATINAAGTSAQFTTTNAADAPVNSASDQSTYRWGRTRSIYREFHCRRSLEVQLADCTFR